MAPPAPPGLGSASLSQILHASEAAHTAHVSGVGLGRGPDFDAASWHGVEVPQKSHLPPRRQREAPTKRNNFTTSLLLFIFSPLVT